MTTERWKQINLFGEDLNYDISSLGNIRKHDTQKILTPSKDKDIENSYEFYGLKFKNGTVYNTGIHRLVALAFIEIPERYLVKGYTANNLQVDHKDKIRYHNSVDNLRWCTAYENMQNTNPRYIYKLPDETVIKICDALEKDTNISAIAKKFNTSPWIVRSIQHKNSYRHITKDRVFKGKQITEADVHNICKLIVAGKTTEQIAKELNIPASTVMHIRTNTSWTHISKNYTFPSRFHSDETIRKICELLELDNSFKYISRELGVSEHTVSDVYYGKSHTDISKDYAFLTKGNKYSDNIVHAICKDLERGIKTLKEIAEENNVTKSYVKDIKYRNTRTDISKNYKW